MMNTNYEQGVESSENCEKNKNINGIAEIDTNITFDINSMSPENKKSFLSNYLAKIKYMKDNYSKVKYYEILNLNPNSDSKMIRKSYLFLSKLLSVNKKLSSEYEECYYLIQKSYKILTDKFEKFYYDVLNNYINEYDIETTRGNLHKEADTIYANKIDELKDAYNKKLKEEENKNGLIIEKALFGNLVLKDEHIDNCLNIDSINEIHLQGPFIDLTVVLQCRVENSSLLFNDDVSFAHFCDIPKPLIQIPCEKKKSYICKLEDTEMHLYVKYKFLNVCHELIVVDRSNFTLPQSAHRLFGNHICGPFSPVNIIKMKHLSSSFLDNFFQFFSKNKVCISLFTTFILFFQSIKSMKI